MKAVTVFMTAFLTAASSGAQASPPVEAALSEIAAQVTRADLLCSGFEQEKVLQALGRPLRSSGKLVFVLDQGVLWQITSPYPVRLLVRRDELVEWDADGTPRRSGYGRTPYYRALSGVFQAFFQGDFALLQEHFQTRVARDGETWKLALTPKDETVTKAVSELQVVGARFVESLTIFEPQGDRTEIHFVNPRSESCKLEDVEKAYFAQ